MWLVGGWRRGGGGEGMGGVRKKTKVAKLEKSQGAEEVGKTGKGSQEGNRYDFQIIKGVEKFKTC
jgi:hypothetical protein